MAKLSKKFFQQSTPDIAQSLLGCRLNHRLGSVLLTGIIVETEAYLSENDRASHSARGETPRNRVMFGPPGHLYVYTIHNRHCINVVCESMGLGAAVLIRAVEPIHGVEWMTTARPVDKLRELTNGPGKLSQAFGLDLRCNGIDLMTSDTLWLESRAESMQFQCRATPRIGISQAKELPLRFFVDGNAFVSGRAMDHSIPRNRSFRTAVPTISK